MTVDPHHLLLAQVCMEADGECHSLAFTVGKMEDEVIDLDCLACAHKNT